MRLRRGGGEGAEYTEYGMKEGRRRVNIGLRSDISKRRLKGNGTEVDVVSPGK